MAFFRNKKSIAWVEESFSFDRPTPKQMLSPTGKAFIGSSISKNKSAILYVIVLVIFFLFIAKIFFLQIMRGTNYRLLADNNRERVIPVFSERGVIYDRNSLPLTKNIPNFSLAIIPQDLPRTKELRDIVIKRLADTIGEDEQIIRDAIEAYKSYRYESVVIAENIPYEKALLVLIKASDLPGITIQQGSKRLYLDNGVNAPEFAHVLGYVGKLGPVELEQLYKDGYLPSDSIGKTGVEKIYENVLRGTYGKKRIEVNAQGKEQSVLSQIDPIPGNHIVLTIDSNIQTALSEIVSRHITAAHKDKASAVAINPNNGEVIALVSIPPYNNNDFSGGIDVKKYQSYIQDKNQPLFSRAIGGTYPSGSSLKPAMSAAALEEGVITEATTFVSTGGLAVGNWFFPDWLTGGHGVTNVRKSLAWSVNTFYYYIGGGFGKFEGLGIDRIHKYLNLFGFGKKTGIDLPGEAAGFIPTPEWKKQTIGEQWYIGDTYNISIGQGYFLTTPLQIANMTAAVANGGTVYVPHVMRAIINAQTKEITEKSSQIIANQFIDQINLRTVRLGMRDCVTVGSCHRLASLPFTSAGKTGTAQWSNGKDTHAWFTSFAPFEKPEIVLTIMVEEGGEGGIIGTPIATEFYDWWWKYKNK